VIGDESEGGDTIVYHSSTSTYMPSFVQIEKTFCVWMDGHRDIETGFIR